MSLPIIWATTGRPVEFVADGVENVLLRRRRGVDAEVLGPVDVGAAVRVHQRPEGAVGDFLHRRQRQERRGATQELAELVDRRRGEQSAAGHDRERHACSSHTFASSTITSTAFSMSCTDTHSSREWKFCSPAKMFGVGSPMNDSRDPSVPPRIGRSRGSPTA